MWSFNVTRFLVRDAGLDLIPERVPQNDPEMFSAAELYLKSKPTNTRCVIKVHTLINASSSVKVIRNRRDLRDRIYSLCRFMEYSFNEQSITDEVSRSFEEDSHYDRWPAGYIINIPFESIETDSIELIKIIAGFIDLPTPAAQTIRDIDFQFSKMQVKKQIADLDDRVFDRDGNIKNSTHPDAVVNAGPGRARAFDVTSGFQSEHVSDYRPGDWQHLWTDRQKQIVDNAIRTAQKNRIPHDDNSDHQ